MRWLDCSDGSDTHKYFHDACRHPVSPRDKWHCEDGQCHCETTRPDTPDSLEEYYTLSAKRAGEIGAAAEELHTMFLAATERVVNDASLLSTFGIPPALVDRVRESFASHRGGRGHHPIAGRFDLAVDDKEVKAYEYNADSASCLYECGSAQGAWARAVALDGLDSGAPLAQMLTAAWRDAGIAEGAALHLMYDENAEENYHARYMRDAAAKAGIRTKLVAGVDGLRWKGGRVVDIDGEALRFVWKSWSWETVFDVHSKSALNRQDQPTDNSKPNLADALLHDDVTVWEPMWTAITNNKAILPVLSEMFPHSPHLLRAEFDLSTELRNCAAGYVTKPIVGRCGSNVTMFAAGGAVVAQLGGQFSSKDVVYQEARALPCIDGQSVLLCPWMVRGKYAGMVLRVDEALITTVDSRTECLRIVPDEYESDTTESISDDDAIQ